MHGLKLLKSFVCEMEERLEVLLSNLSDFLGSSTSSSLQLVRSYSRDESDGYDDEE